MPHNQETMKLTSSGVLRACSLTIFACSMLATLIDRELAAICLLQAIVVNQYEIIRQNDK